MNVGVPDLLVQELPGGPRALGGDLLRLVADVEGRDLPALLVGRQLARHHPDEGGLAGPVLAEQDEDLAVGELAGVHVQLEAAHRLGHLRVVITKVG